MYLRHIHPFIHTLLPFLQESISTIYRLIYVETTQLIGRFRKFTQEKGRESKIV